jgi:hypothetical protein
LSRGLILPYLSLNIKQKQIAFFGCGVLDKEPCGGGGNTINHYRKGGYLSDGK